MVCFTQSYVGEKLEDKLKQKPDRVVSVACDNYIGSGMSLRIDYELYGKEQNDKIGLRYNEVEKPIVDVAPLMPIERKGIGEMGPGLYGLAMIAKYINVREGVYNPKEINDHEQLHQNDPSMSEYLVRVIIRWRHGKTYHQ